MILETGISTVTVLPAESVIVLGYPASGPSEAGDESRGADEDATTDEIGESKSISAKSAHKDVILM